MWDKKLKCLEEGYIKFYVSWCIEFDVGEIVRVKINYLLIFILWY